MLSAVPVITCTTKATSDPVTVAEVKARLRVVSSDDDATIALMISEATAHVQELTGRQLMTATWAQRHDSFPSVFVLRVAPVASITSIKYIDTDGAQQTLDSSVYHTDLSSEPARITLDYNQSWPDIREEFGSVIVAFSAGYSSAAAVPAPIKHAIYLHCAFAYEYREPDFFGAIPRRQALDLALQAILHPYIVREWQ